MMNYENRLEKLESVIAPEPITMIIRRTIVDNNLKPKSVQTWKYHNWGTKDCWLETGDTTSNFEKWLGDPNKIKTKGDRS